MVRTIVGHYPTCVNIEVRLDEDKEPITPLARAASEGFVDVVSILASLRNINWNVPNNSRLTPMHFAARGGHTDVVKALASLPNVSASATDNGGRTPMHYAASHGHTDIVNALASLPKRQRERSEQ